MRRLTSLWYWRYRLELVMGRFGWVPLSEYRKLQASYMKVCAENWNCGKIGGFTSEENAVIDEAINMVSRMYVDAAGNWWLRRPQSAARGTPCS